MGSSIPMLQGWWDQIQPGVNSVAGGIQDIINPNLKFQELLKQQIAQNPEIGQKLIDLEAQNPGSVAKIFGQQAAPLGQGTPSFAQQMQGFLQQNANTPTSKLPDTVLSNAAGSKAGIGTTLSREGAQTAIDANKQQQDYYKAELTATEIKNKYLDQIMSNQVKAGELDFNIKQSAFNQNAKDLANFDSAIGKYNGSGSELVDSLYNQLTTGKKLPHPLTEDERNAAFSNKGVMNELNQRMDNYRLQIQEQAVQKADARQEDRYYDAMARQDATYFQTKIGKDVNPDNLRTIYKDHLQTALSQYVAMNNPEQFAKMFPEANKIIQNNPSLVDTFKERQAALKSIDSEYISRAAQDYNKAYTDMLTRMHSSKPMSEGEAQSYISGILNPQADRLESMGITVPRAEIKKGDGFLWFGGKPEARFSAGGSSSSSDTSTNNSPGVPSDVPSDPNVAKALSHMEEGMSDEELLKAVPLDQQGAARIAVNEARQLYNKRHKK